LATCRLKTPDEQDDEFDPDEYDPEEALRKLRYAGTEKRGKKRKETMKTGRGQRAAEWA